MTTTEILVIAFGLFLGYWIVAKLIGGRSKPDHAPTERSPVDRDVVQRAESTLSAEWHEVLLVDRTASVAQIRAAYESLMGQYHPDKVAQLSAETRSLAQRRTHEIEAAYHEALHERGYE